MSYNQLLYVKLKLSNYYSNEKYYNSIKHAIN